MSSSKLGSASSSPKIRAWAGDVGLLGVWIALAIVVRPPAWEAMRALEPRPDALEYCVSASHLASGHGFVLRIGQADYPPRWEPGFPLTLAVWSRVAGPLPESAAALQSLLTVVSVALLYVAVRRVASRKAASLAVLLICFSGLDLGWSRTVMSECLLVALACGFLLAVSSPEAPSRISWLTAGLCAGVMTTLRPTQLLGAMAIASLAAFQKPRLRSLTACLIGASAALLPWLWFHAARFGSPLASGYSNWLGDVVRPENMFGLRYLTHGSGQGGNLRYYGLALVDWRFGAWTWAGIALCVIGVCGSREWRRSMLAAIATLAIPASAFLVYAWADRRFFASLLPFLAFSTALGAERLWRSRNRWIRVAGLGLAMGALAQALVQWHNWPALPENRNAREIAGLRSIHPVVRPGDVVISDAPVVLVSWVLPETVPVALSGSEDEHVRRIRERGLQPLKVHASGARSPASSAFMVRALLTSRMNVDPITKRLFRTAWRRRSRVYILLTSARERWVSMLRFKSWLPKRRLVQIQSDANALLFELRPPAKRQRPRRS